MSSRRENGMLGYLKSCEHMEEQRKKQHDEAVSRFEASAKVCPKCGKRLTYAQRFNTFCSQSCSASTHNNSRKRYSCRFCGTPVRCDLRYCGPVCKLAAYKARRSLESAGSDASRRRILIEERGRFCEVCQHNSWMGQPIPIELDHIDGNSDNNGRDNLRLICPNCHAQTSTYKAKNKGRAGSRGTIRLQKMKQQTSDEVDALQRSSTG